MQKHVILAAGGSGTRMGTEENKIFLSVCGQSVLSRSIQLFDRLIDSMMIVCRKEDLSGIENIVSSSSVSFSILRSRRNSRYILSASTTDTTELRYTFVSGSSS